MKTRAPFDIALSIVAFAVSLVLDQPLRCNAEEPGFTHVGHPTFVSPHASPIAIQDNDVFVVNTPADTLDVIDAETKKIATRINVGIDPVSVSIRPDGMEVWVSNHVSDSVSVVDNDPKSATYRSVIATVQDFHRRKKSTEFDEPIGIAFASNEKAYVALSSENEIAVIDVKSRKVKKRLRITAQDPRAIVVRGERLYVIPFESNNKTQLSGGTGELDGNLVTFNAWEHSVANNNVLSLGAVLDIVKHPEVPDRDLYVFDTKNEKLLEVVDTLGTLLYGLAVDSKGRVYIAQTDARNDANGRAGTKKHGLKELENRAFLNRITVVDFEDDGAKEPDFFDLEPLPPHHPAEDKALATPFGIQVSEDDSTLVVTSAGSDKLFTVDAKSGLVLGQADVGAVPRGVALTHEDGTATKAWVLNAVGNTVSLVDIASPSQPAVVETVELEDPTHPTIKRGRIAFNKASASTTNTFSCASCHPDGHTDQLLWVLKTPIVTGGDQIMPRSTMPIRGLRDTAPYHWDGIPGDPYGGNNSANVYGEDKPNSTKEVATSTTRHLIDGGLAATMATVGTKLTNDEGLLGELTAAERDDMAAFLFSVPYPPAQGRAYTNVLSSDAEEGFKLFHIDGDYQDDPTPNVCGNCHRMPFWVSTNTPGTGMDAPTWRGANDRFLILPQGRLNIIDFDFYRNIAERGIPERNMWQFSWAGRRRFDPVWNMVLEGSTGYSGSFARQITVNKDSVNQELTADLVTALELSASEGAVVLELDGVFIDDDASRFVAMQFDGDQYREVHHANVSIARSDDVERDLKSQKDSEGCEFVAEESRSYSSSDLIQRAKEGSFVGTLTARHGRNADTVGHPQPAIWTLGPIEQQRGRQEFPMLYPGDSRMTVSGRHVCDDANLIVDGRRVEGMLRVDPEDELVEIELAELPSVGMHLIQLQNPSGLFSNDFIFHVTENDEDARQLKRRIDRAHIDTRQALGDAASRGDIEEVETLLDEGADVNARQTRGGSTALSNAALRGNVEMVQFLIKQGASAEKANEDGNSPLHAAAFMCHEVIVKLLLKEDASPLVKNDRGETVVDVVSGEWSEELAGFYSGLSRLIGAEVDLDRMQRQRPEMAKLLREHAGASSNE